MAATSGVAEPFGEQVEDSSSRSVSCGKASLGVGGGRRGEVALQPGRDRRAEDRFAAGDGADRPQRLWAAPLSW
jgi:hypothetical protein